ncbi:hypothetical protein [uncultured Roseovarius sp.]|uniref:hypothetical protein n=1 Tax=uncultured Roseovarius sp. TaxID=293344 RepID=UPI0026252470|nr:hypothetical protein [uncultured Roseovarius sp.]
MTIFFKTCLKRDVLYAKWQGRISVNEFIDVFHAYTQGDHYMPGRSELIDTSEMIDFDVSFHEMRGLLRNVNSQSTYQSVKTKTVIFCPNDYIFGLSHMYQKLAELDNGIKVELYEKEHEALAALNLPYSTIYDFLVKETLL